MQDEISLGEHWILVPGLRVELIQSNFDNRLTADDPDRVGGSRFDVAVIPGGGAVYRPIEELSLLAGVHKGFSPVTPGQAEGIDPEESINYEAGARVHPEKFSGNTIRAESIGFLNDYSNLTAECTFSAGCGDADIGSSSTEEKSLSMAWKPCSDMIEICGASLS